MDLTKFSEILGKDIFLKEALYLGLGLVFVFGVNIIFFVDVNQIPNYQDFKSLLGIILVIPISYFMGRLSYQMGYFLSLIAHSLLRFQWREDFKKSFINYIKYIKSDIYTPSNEDISLRTIHEAIEGFKDSVYIKTRFDESRKELLISYAFSGFIFLTILGAILLPTRIPINVLIIIDLILITDSCFKNYAHGKAGRRLAAMSARIERNRNNKE